MRLESPMLTGRAERPVTRACGAVRALLAPGSGGPSGMHGIVKT